MDKYLVTGSAGFIGFYVSRALLERGDEVVGIDNLNPYYSVQLKNDRNAMLQKFENYKFHECDLSERDKLCKILDSQQPNIVCHLAAQAGVRYSFENPYVYERSNLAGFLNLVEWAKSRVDNFVYASSSSVYGGNDKIPFSETDRVDKPISLYAATKMANELMAHVYHKLFGLRLTGLRFFSVYGPWGRPDMALYKFSLKIVKGEQIEVYGHGKMKRDFTYIADMVPAILNALAQPQEYEIYNLGGSDPVELMYFISLIEKGLGVEAKKVFKDIQPGEFYSNYADIEKARSALGFEPKTSIEDGVKTFVEWFKGYHGV